MAATLHPTIPGMQLAPSTVSILDGKQFEVVVIGGGINGAAIARECARGGKRTLLLEKDDFASGATSRATRIIHGGLRYLEHGEIGLVRESLREREKLLRERPHLVRPMEFLLAVPKHRWGRRSALAIRFGLWLYQRAARHRSFVPIRSDLNRFEQMLDGGVDLNVFPYEDAQCEYPERLAAEWVGEAITAGAIVHNHTEVRQIDVHEGKAKAIIARDAEGKEARIRADWIISATGPWVDVLRAQSNIPGTPLVRGVRGSHLVLRSFPGAPTKAIYAEAGDGRPVFMIPWADQILVGTTEVRQDGNPGEPKPSEAETRYLWDSLRHALRNLLPHARVSWSDVNYLYAGVRPLPSNGDKDLGAVTRRHIIHDHLEDGVAGLISIIGGKLTTAGAVGRECARKIGVRVAPDPQSIVAIGPASGIDSTLRHWAAMAAKLTGLSPASAYAIAEWHGRSALRITRLAASSQYLRNLLCPHTPHVVAEAVEAIHHESAATLGDILLRRVPVALGPCWSRTCSIQAAVNIGAALGWRPREIDEHVERFESERSAFLIKPEKSSTGLKLFSQCVA